MRRCSVLSGVPVAGLTIVIVVRVAVSHVSQSFGVCGWSAKSGVLQIGQHPSWALSSHRLVLLIGRTGLRLRRAQYSASAGSSGDAPCLTSLVSDDAGPGEAVHVGAALAVTEHPPVLPGLVELAEVPGGHPGRRLVRVAEPGPLVGEPPQVLVELVEDLGRYVCPVVVGPAPDDRVEPLITALALLLPRRERSSSGVVPGSV